MHYKEDRSEWIQCECHSHDHLLHVYLDTEYDEDTAALYISPLLNFRPNFFRRIWIAIKYVFRVNPRFGYHFDEVIVSGENLDNLGKLVTSARTINRLRKRKKDAR